jgi:hypothetical protein
MTRSRKGKRNDGVPPLQNEDVTGLSEPRQDEVIRESGRAAQRRDAAREFLDEQREQAQSTAQSVKREDNSRVAGSTGDDHAGVAEPGQDTELHKHWDPNRSAKRP